MYTLNILYSDLKLEKNNAQINNIFIVTLMKDISFVIYTLIETEIEMVLLLFEGIIQSVVADITD